MTTPTGAIKMSDVRLEIYGSGTGQIDMNDANVRTLAGVPSGAISMSQLKGKTWAVFTPNGGTVADTEAYPTNASVELVCNVAAVWTYNLNSQSGPVSPNVSIGNGASSTSIVFTLASSASGISVASYSVTGTVGSTSKTFTVNLEADSLQ